MNKIFEWISKHRKLIASLFGMFIFTPILIIHFLFKIRSNCYWIEAEWSAGDMLGYFGDVLSFIGTTILGYVAIMQTKEANLLSNELVKLEWEKRKPFLDIVQNQEYSLYFSYEEIQAYLNEYNIANDMLIRPCYIYREKFSSLITIAAMRIEMINTGNSDIRWIYIKKSDSYLGAINPMKFDTCIVTGSFEGNTYIKAGEKKRLFIIFHQELNEEEDIEQQLEWAVDCRQMIPSLEFDLRIVTTDGNEYEEHLWCKTSLSYINEEEHKIVRNLTTMELTVKKTNE